ncbi:MAG: hypothetical protein JWN34_507 [Bryobacterales bacterium]|nr:hypothetical protein [Bryobacterales bacterium]
MYKRGKVYWYEFNARRGARLSTAEVQRRFAALDAGTVPPASVEL